MGDMPNPARTFKDRIFRMIYKGKAEFLELYNALNGTDYSDTDELIITTLDNAVYIGMKNDVSYLLHDELSLYEHQSTKNPNMPLRSLFYVSNVYSALTRDEDLHGSKLVKIPAPQFVVFYNGVEPMPERSVCRLSDMYVCHGENVSLELETLVLNINPGYNEKLMEKCRTLRDYMLFVSYVREYGRTMPLPEAMNHAVDTCISNGILADFLKKNRAEVVSMGIFEYDEEFHRRKEREYAMELGIEKGSCMTLISKIRKKMEKGMAETVIADILEEELTFVSRICELMRSFPDADDEALCDLWLAECPA